MKKFFIIIILFTLDRACKIYLINLQSAGVDVDFYIFSFLNFYLIWNTGVAFGLASLESNIYYHMLTLIILTINFVLIYLMIKAKGMHEYIYAIIIGGSLGNLFDRIYYYAVPDFIDIHIGGYHWFIFNIADIFITVGIISLIFVELFNKEKISRDVYK